MTNIRSRFPAPTGRGGRQHPLTMKQAEPFRGGPRHPRALTPLAKIIKAQEAQEHAEAESQIVRTMKT